MRNYRKILTLILTFGVQVLFAQELVKEQVNYSIPKSIYFTGEKIWLEASVFQNEKPSTSQVLYAELLNRENQSVHVEKFLLEKGRVFHFLEIPENLPSDHYLLRVFTRVSPLIDLENGLKQEFITIFNPTKPPKVSAESITRAFSIAESSASLRLSSSEVKAGEKLTLKFGDLTEIQEISVAIFNPFLQKSGQIPSKVIYQTEVKGDLVPELFGHIVTARVDPKLLDTTRVYFLSVHGMESALYTDRADAEGVLHFDIGGLKHWEFVIAQADQNGSLLDFELQSPAVQTAFKSDFIFPELEIGPNDEAFLRQLLISSGVQTFYSERYEQEPIPVVTGFVADRTFLLDDYTRFETVETVIKEYVPMIAVRTRQGKKQFRSVNEFGNSFSENPLMLVDGMPVFDSDQMASFNPESFEKLDVLSRRFYLNEQEYEGVMSFSTYEGNVGGFPLPSNAIFSQYKGIQIPIEMEKSLSQPGSLADLRSLLFWSKDPLQNLPDSRELEILTSQLPGEFEIKVKFKNQDGSLTTALLQFEVKGN
ncbi:hypothetical protein [Algoriphagus sp.]|uniref:hypothetical protein n=1 Tax=Algoriphagus sp. TaxID=1872435 RepID=UPI00261D889D|nr:hypothetical protein [Algoriphagus sp.]